MLPRPKMLCALVAVLAGLGSGLAATTAPAAAADKSHLQVDIDSMTPYVNSSTKQVRISGHVVNDGEVPLWTVNAMLWFHQAPLTTRKALSDAAAEQPGDRLGVRLDEPWNLVDEVATTLEPHKSAKFDVVVPVSQLKLTTGGVYVVGVDVRAMPPNSNSRETWRARTFLPYIPKATPLTPVEVSFLLPITETPSLVAGDVLSGSAAPNGATTYVGDPNPKEFGPNGRLTRLLQLGSANGLTFVVDPELLSEAEHMANGYYTSADQKITASQAADVRHWLNRARGVFAAGHTLMLPYADPDITALQKFRLTDRFGRAVSSAKESVKQYKANGTLAWPGTGYADGTTLETIAASGAKTVLLSTHALPRLPADGSSPVASLSTPEGALTALVVDPTLTAGGPGAHGPASVQQRFLAETALLAMQGNASPSALRRVVAAFPRNWNPGTGGSTLFSTVDSTPWLRPVKTTALLSQAPTAYGGPVTTSVADSRAALSPAVVSHLRQLSVTTDTLLDLLAEPERSRPDLDRALLRGTSMAWRQDPRQAIDLIDTMDANLRAEIGQVTVVRPRLVTLSSQSGRFPITISNEGDLPVQVQLEVRPRDPELLTVEPIEPVRVDGHRKATVSVTAATTGGGAVQMEVRVATPSGTEFGNPESFQVRVTGYGQVGWAVIGVGLGLMFLAALARILRRVRNAILGRRRAASDAGAVSAEAALGDSAGAAEIAVDAGAVRRELPPGELATPATPARFNGRVSLTDAGRQIDPTASDQPEDHPDTPTDSPTTRLRPDPRQSDNGRSDSDRTPPHDDTPAHDDTPDQTRPDNDPTRAQR